MCRTPASYTHLRSRRTSRSPVGDPCALAAAEHDLALVSPAHDTEDGAILVRARTILHLDELQLVDRPAGGLADGRLHDGALPAPVLGAGLRKGLIGLLQATAQLRIELALAAGDGDIAADRQHDDQDREDDHDDGKGAHPREL